MAALAALLVADAVKPGSTFWYRDLYSYWSMQAECFVRVVADGSFPTWNPYVSFGLPMLADPSYQVAYPVTWLNVLLDVVSFYKVYTLLHLSWASAGLYVLLARWGHGRVSAFAGAATWLASAPLLVVVSHTHHFAGTAWIPWVLLGLDGALMRPSARSAIGLALACAGQVLAGSGDLCLMTAFAGAGLIGARAAEMWPPAAGAWKPIGRTLCVGGALGAALSAIQWLPTLALLPTGLRTSMSDIGRLYWSLHPLSLLDFLVPRLVTDLPIDAAARAALFESREPLFAVQYLGAATSILAAWGIAAPRTPLRVFARLGLLVALLLALGRHTPLYPALAATTPLGMLRFPSKYLLLVGFFWAVVVADGVSAWRGGELTRRRRRAILVLAGASALAAAAASLWLRSEPAAVLRHLESGGRAALELSSWRLAATSALIAGAGLLSLAAGRAGRAARVSCAALLIVSLADLVRVGRTVNPGAPAALLTGRPSWASATTPGGRLYVSQRLEGLRLARVPEGWRGDWAGALARVEHAWPPLGARAGFHGSFDGDFTGLGPPLLSNLSMIVDRAEGTALGLRILQLAGVDYVVTTKPDAWPGLELAASGGAFLQHALRVLRVPASAPDAYFVGRARLAGEPRSVLLLRDAGFDPEREVIIAGVGPDRGSAEAVGAVREVVRRADRLEYDVEAGAAGFLVVLQTHDAGWRASVNGVAAPLLRANALFQAVEVRAGTSRVVLAYRPQAVVVGATLSGLAALALIAAAAASLLNRHGAAQ